MSEKEVFEKIQQEALDACGKLAELVSKIEENKDTMSRKNLEAWLAEIAGIRENLDDDLELFQEKDD